MTYSDYQVNQSDVELTVAYVDVMTRTYYTPKTYIPGEIPLRLVEEFEKASGKQPKLDLVLDTSKQVQEVKLVIETPPTPTPETSENSLNFTNNQAKVERLPRKTKTKV